MVRTYYLLTKPGIIMGNALTVTAGFLLASKGHIDFVLFLTTVLGLSLIIASACVFNNYIDRNIDKKMARTKNRALVQGLISGPRANIFATVLGTLGVLILAIYTNGLALWTSVFGFFIYVVLYAFWKRRSVYGTIVGSISGAVPPVVGYVAVSNKIDAVAIIFFLILVLWQMPHFFSIAIYRFKDYKAAGLPVLPVKKGIANTKINMVFYTILFIFAIVALTVLGHAGYTYLIAVLLISLYWLYTCLKGFTAKDDIRWARKMFRVSLLVVTIMSVFISLDAWLP